MSFPIRKRKKQMKVIKNHSIINYQNEKKPPKSDEKREKERENVINDDK